MTSFTTKSSFFICWVFSILCKPAPCSVCLPWSAAMRFAKVMFTYSKKPQQILIALLLSKTCSLYRPLNQLPGRLLSFVCFAAFCLINTWMSVQSLSHSLALLVGQQCPCHPHQGHSVYFCISGYRTGSTDLEADILLASLPCSQVLQVSSGKSSFSLSLQALSQCSASVLANSHSISLECKFLSLPTGTIQEEPNSSCARRDSGWILGKFLNGRKVA